MRPALAVPRVGEKLRETVERAALSHQHSMVANVVTISVGAASTKPAKENALGHLIEQADQALYLAKEKGRNQVVGFRKVKAKGKRAS